MFELRIKEEDAWIGTNKKYDVQLVDRYFSGMYETPMENMTKEQSIELMKEILKTTKNYLEKEFPDCKNNRYFIKCFENI